MSIFYTNFACRQCYNKWETYQTWCLIEDLCPTPWVHLGSGVKMSKFNLFRTWSFCISNLRESWMQHHGSKYFARRAPLTPIPWPWDQKVNIQLFKNMVRLHIKLNHECRDVVANILPPDPSNHKQILGVGSNVKINFFKTWSCCISNKITNAETW